jgi:hypothetical protein
MGELEKISANFDITLKNLKNIGALVERLRISNRDLQTAERGIEYIGRRN